MISRDRLRIHHNTRFFCCSPISMHKRFNLQLQTTEFDRIIYRIQTVDKRGSLTDRPLLHLSRSIIVIRNLAQCQTMNSTGRPHSHTSSIQGVRLRDHLLGYTFYRDLFFSICRSSCLSSVYLSLKFFIRPNVCCFPQ